MTTYPYPRPFIGDPFDVEPDTDHPSPDGHDDTPRLVLERHIHKMRHDATDAWDHVPVTAVYWPGVDQVIELGPWSLNVEGARLLAQSLTTLADLIDVDGPNALIHTTTKDH
ncbi:hypothetical protein GALL_341350 [mine drainage metagenome]|uniref:Uncharacterized protein n=1 Tax=mine drainage metagenome TaxID=410659 RepID=A0A1J5QW14_9ZZZZ